jgi:hypothetical protein
VRPRPTLSSVAAPAFIRLGGYAVSTVTPRPNAWRICPNSLTLAMPLAG